MEQKSKKKDHSLLIALALTALVIVGTGVYNAIVKNTIRETAEDPDIVTVSSSPEITAVPDEAPDVLDWKPEDFESAVLLYEKILKAAYDGNCAAVFDGTENVAHFTLWADGLDAYALDSAKHSQTDLSTWQEIEYSTCKQCKKIKENFAELGYPDTVVVMEILDAGDYRTVLARVEDGLLEYDIVTDTPDGESIARKVYGDTRGLSPAFESICNYILNTSTKVFHRPDCRMVSQISDENKAAGLYDRDTVITLGYRPCEICCP